MEKLKEQRYRGYVIAGIGGIVAFIAFFLPYLTYSQFGGSISANASQAASFNGLLWIELLIAIAAAAIPALLIYRSNPLGSATTPIEKQIRWGIYGLIGAGALGVLAQFIFAITVNSYSILGVSLTSLGVGYGFGYWLYLLSAIAIVVGGVMAYRTMPALIAGQSSWQYPSSTQYPPYGQQYPAPPTQYPPYQSADQTPYPSYPAQYPPADQQQYQPTELKQPYPPTGPQQYQPTEYQQPPYQQQYPPQQQYPQQQYPPQQYPPSQ